MVSPQEHSFSFRHVCLAPSQQIGLHRQSSWELSYIIVGSGTRLIGDRTEPFRPGEAVLIPPDIPHAWFFTPDDTDPNGRISNITLTFTDDFLNDCGAVFPELRCCVKRLQGIDCAVKFDRGDTNTIVSILTSMNKQEEAERLASLIRLLIVLSSAQEARPAGMYKKTDKEQERLKRIHTYIICNATRNISLDEVVRYVGMNRSAFCVFFKRTTGKTFISYLNEYRIERACELLKERNRSVSDICYQVGFTNISYFNRIFKKIKGCSPTQFVTGWLG